MDKLSRRRLLRTLSGGALVAGGRALGGLAAAAVGGCSGFGGDRSYTAPILSSDNDSVVFEWTDIMLQAARDLSLSPLQASRGFAMAHLAGGIATNRDLKSPVAQIEPSGDIEPAVAYGVAFSHALEEAWQVSLAHSRRRFLNRYHDMKHKDQSIKWGKVAANAVIRRRTRDGAEPSKSDFYPPAYPKRKDNMAWSPTGPLYGATSGPAFETFRRGISPGWGRQKPWVIDSVIRYQADPFPDYRSNEFLQQFKKVLEFGGSDSERRTREQSEIALFWEDGPRGVTLPGHFQLIAIDIIQSRPWSLSQQARFFAVLSMAQADAAIVAWHNKYLFDIVRPETAIRFAHRRFPGFAGLSQQSDWRSYVPTPAFPTYVSGHSVFGAASAGAMSLMLGSDRINVTGIAPDLTNWPVQLSGLSRTWTSLNALAEENGASREYGGVHWESDNLQGLKLGYEIGQTAVNNTY
ncbi:MAG: vanadium-dependent haloperoxidase [bacterium]